MSLLSVTQSNAAGSPVTAAGQSSAASVEDVAIAAFTKVLGEAVSFTALNNLPSLSGLVQQSAMSAANAPAPTPAYQPNDQQGNNDSSYQTSAQSSANTNTTSSAPQRQTSSRTDNSQTSKTGPVKDDKQTDAQSQSANDPSASANQPVLEMLVGQMTQQPQTVDTTPTVTVATTQQAAVQQDPLAGQQQTAATPDMLAQGQDKAGPQVAAPVGPVAANANASAQGAKADDAAHADPFADLLASQSDTAQAAATVKTAAKTAQGPQTGANDLTTQAGQANDLAQSLNGTGANLQVKVTVNGQQAAASTDTSAPVVTGAGQFHMGPSVFDAMGNGAQNQSGSANSQDQSADPSIGLATASTAATTANGGATAASFNAALVAQMEANQPSDPTEQQPQVQPQAIQGVGATTATQATQKTAPTQAPQTPTPTRTATQADILDQVSVEIDKQAQDGVDTIKVKLNPQELGHIEIKLDVAKDGTVQATVTADNKETLAMLQKDAPSLAKALSDAGLSTDAGSMNFNLQGGEQQQQQFAGNSNGQNGGSSNSRRWAAAQTGEDMGTLGQSGGVSQGAGGLSAVDISV